jgi:putative ABC transport system substrate-binding protein
LVPKATLIAVLTNPNSLTRQDELQGLFAAARSIHEEVSVVNASSEHQVDEAFAAAVHQRAGALFVLADAVFTNHRDQVVALAARHAMPAIYHDRDFVNAGGLISYGPNLADEWRKTGIYAGRILKGSRPADLPIVLPTKFEMVINLKTAKALSLTGPDKLLALADEVIE